MDHGVSDIFNEVRVHTRGPYENPKPKILLESSESSESSVNSVPRQLWMKCTFG